MVDRKQALQNIAKKGKTEVTALEKELTEIIETMPNTPDRERLALRELNNRYSGPPDNTSKFDICIVGVYKLGDFSAKPIKEAKQAYKKNPEDALERGLVKKVDGEIVALDIQKTIDYGKGPVENKDFGKPLTHSWSRNVLALVREEGETAWNLEVVALRGDFANTSLPELYTPLTANLLGSIDGHDLKSAKTSKFNPSEVAIDFATELSKLASDKVVMLGDCFDEAKKHSKEDEGFYDRFVLTSGECKFMNDPKSEGGNFNGTFDDYTTDKMISAFVDPVLGKPSVDQEYNLIAQTSIKKGYDKKTKKETDEDILVLNVLGFYQS